MYSKILHIHANRELLRGLESKRRTESRRTARASFLPSNRSAISSCYGDLNRNVEPPKPLFHQTTALLFELLRGLESKRRTAQTSFSPNNRSAFRAVTGT